MATTIETRAQLLGFIAEDAALASLYEVVGQRMDTDPGHDLGHLERVALWTIRLGGAEVDPGEAVAAALLHDIVNVPKNSPDRARASELCAAEARNLLAQTDRFDAQATDRIADAIVDHSFSRGAVPRSDLGRALQDADRLEAVGAIGLARTFSTGARMGASYFHNADPWANERERDDYAFTVDHFFKKLLLLAPTLQTEAGRAEAQRRSEWMKTFLVQLGQEIGEAPPKGLLERH